MIHGSKNELQTTLAALDNLPFHFHLTGSRAFKTANNASDWDFFTADDPDLDAQLTKLGFTQIGVGDYAHQGLVRIFEHKPLKIHVQCVNNVGIKIKAQKLILALLSSTQLAQMSKPNQKKMWSAVIQILEEK